jgi:effector-binding domain-containing protein
MIETPQIVQTERQPTAVIHLTVSPVEIRTAYGPAFFELTKALAAQGIAPTGVSFSHHLQLPGEMFDVELGVPVSGAVDASGRVKGSELPATRVARTVYHGAMEGLGQAWGELGKWAAANGHRTAPSLWENYLVGPQSGGDPSTWRTELNWPLQD